MLPILEVKSIVPYHYQILKYCSESSTKNILLKMPGSVNDPPKHNPPILIRTPWPLTLHPAMHNALKMEKITPKRKPILMYRPLKNGTIIFPGFRA